MDTHVLAFYTFKWAKWAHRNKPRPWIIQRYFGAFNWFRQDRWVFGDRDSGAYLVKFSWTSASPGHGLTDSPALASYWAAT